jgi:type VI secretion system protein ImpA
MDGTAAANRETLAWLAEEIIPPPPPPPAPPSAEAEAPCPPAEPVVSLADENDGQPVIGAPDVNELAMQAARQGRTEEAIAMLATAAAQERSGRARFHRKVQLAGICMATGNESIAHPILEELSGEVERRQLEEWESPENVAQPLALLYKCLVKLDRSVEERQKVYDRICRLDPAAALSCAK